MRAPLVPRARITSLLHVGQPTARKDSAAPAMLRRSLCGCLGEDCAYVVIRSPDRTAEVIHVG